MKIEQEIKEQYLDWVGRQSNKNLHSLSHQVRHEELTRREPFVIDPRWKDTGGVLFVIAHPDDEGLMKKAIEKITSAGITATILSLSHGEAGSEQGIPKSANYMKQIRTNEFRGANNLLGTKGVIFESPDYPDSQLPEYELELKQKVLEFVRKGGYGAVITFDYKSSIRDIQHGDHDIAGSVGEYAAEKADVDEIKTGNTLRLLYRPALYFFTTELSHATHIIPLTKKGQSEKMDYFQTVHKSQFGHENRSRMEGMFDAISRGQLADFPRMEMYQKIRDISLSGI